MALDGHTQPFQALRSQTERVTQGLTLGVTCHLAPVLILGMALEGHIDVCGRCLVGFIGTLSLVIGS